MRENSITSVEFLQSLLVKEKEDLRVVDARYVLPQAETPSATQLYQQGHIQGAVYFDIDHICDPNSTLPHMLPSAEDFAKAVGKMGIGNHHKIVVYDQQGFFSAPRVWWMFRLFGHQDVSVLDGGLNVFLKSGAILEKTFPDYPIEFFKAIFHPEWVADKEDIRLCEREKTNIIDMRDTQRYNAQQEEARAGLRSGHIPGAINIPWMTLSDPETGKLLSNDQLKSLLGVLSKKKETISYCGSGVTACSLALALHILGHAPSSKIYDGSWVEWGALDEEAGYPVVKREKKFDE